jgi:hypothetical protein
VPGTAPPSPSDRLPQPVWRRWMVICQVRSSGCTVYKGVLVPGHFHRVLLCLFPSQLHAGPRRCCLAPRSRLHTLSVSSCCRVVQSRKCLIRLCIPTPSGHVTRLGLVSFSLLPILSSHRPRSDRRGLLLQRYRALASTVAAITHFCRTTSARQLGREARSARSSPRLPVRSGHPASLSPDRC